MDRVARQQSSAAALAPATNPRQILFGDLHVHTTYSIDAFLYALPIFASEGGHPPADACDYARYCSSLDFFSINDHAEGITPERWQATIDTLRACNARAGDPASPDLVPLLGWEWTQVGATPEEHWGHKNVVLRGLGDNEVPARPIAFRPASDMQRAPKRWQLRAGESVASLLGPDYADFLWWLGRLLDMPACAKGVHTRELPADCLESADTPEQLFRKLDEWGLDSLVIPHGLAWGIHAPPGARLDNQLTPSQHDPDRQTLLEVFSGHGNSEVYRPWQDRPGAGSETELCPAPTANLLPCCWRAGEIMRERCGDLPAAQCEARVETARRLALQAGVSPHRVFPDTGPADWLDCDECRDCFKPAQTLRAGESAQYGLALSHFDPDAEDEPPLRFRWGFIASSDNHRARSGTGFKQLDRSYSTDARGLQDPAVDALIRRFTVAGHVDRQQPQGVVSDARTFAALFDNERSASFMYPGGLVAVHAAGRGRDALWHGLEKREVYGTSGPRILLWFELLNGPDGPVPMGGEVALDRTPHFQVRAVGAFAQQSGCPEHAVSGLGAARIEDLCRGECYHPSERRHRIDTIEVVRVRPQTAPGQPIEGRIEDPWLRHECPPDPAGCVLEFEDPDFLADTGDHVYYVRALQEPTPAINGDTVRADYDESGRAVSVDPCYGSWLTSEDDDCLAPVRERAWSSPIYVDRAR
ncbi:MAG: DUF3604 domain-containing protein [Deltaproteobacteria bacterium]|nr:DUF3604 domain-containing protein [Deltaproteobacteria bacterium]